MFVPADPAQRGYGATQDVDKPDQVFKLGPSVGFSHFLVIASIPVGKAAGVVELDADTALVETPHMVRHPVKGYPLLDTPTSFYVVVS
jgi:hypothetical protein